MKDLPTVQTISKNVHKIIIWRIDGLLYSECSELSNSEDSKDQTALHWMYFVHLAFEENIKKFHLHSSQG
jgi:hypothetical protein